MNYKIVKFNSEKEWHAWRDTKIGASDASIIGGYSPYKKRADLLHEKKTGEKDKVNDFILNKGHKFEERMRPVAELILDLNLPPLFAESTEIPYLSASLDGYDKDKNIGWECKFCGQSMLEFCEEEQIVPDKYKLQVQQQIYVCGLKKVVFWCGTDEDNYTFFDVYPDEELIEELKQNAKEFWEDWHSDIEAPSDLGGYILEAASIKKEISSLKKKEKAIMDKIKALDFKENFNYQGVSYKRSVSYSDSLNMDRVKADFDLKDYYEKKESVRYLIK